jgi:hypothetical protein
VEASGRSMSKAGPAIYYDYLGKLRWPHGWPCEAIYVPPVSQCRYLRSLVQDHGNAHFGTFTNQFHKRGLVRLEREMAIAMLESLEYAGRPLGAS